MSAITVNYSKETNIICQSQDYKVQLNEKKVAVVGGGPSGLMAADILINNNVCVDLYDSMPSVGRKFLMAGKGGMNITHSEEIDLFISRYSHGKAFIESHILNFTPSNLRDWLSNLGIDTFVGTSGRVFPIEMKAAPLLRLWLHRLRSMGVKFYMRHKWVGWCIDNKITLNFSTSNGVIHKEYDAVLLALGGASWPKLGSTGEWTSVLIDNGVILSPFKSSNCGFDASLSEYFTNKYAGHPLKPVTLSFINSSGCFFTKQGELMFTQNGIEGGLMYGFSHLLTDHIEQFGFATIYLDLLPHLSLTDMETRLGKSQGKLSFVNYLRKQLGLDAMKTALLWEAFSQNDLSSKKMLCAAIKNLPLKLLSSRPIAEAISSSGGINFESLDEHLMIKSIPGVFCAGEMLNWDAPTGGYLLTACFSTGRAAALGVLNRFDSFNQFE